MRVTTFGLCFAVCLSGPAVSGPYFNPPPEIADEVKAEMQTYERLLNDARRNLIDMFDNWEGEPEAARNSLNEAVGILSSAQKVLSNLPEIPADQLNVGIEVLSSDNQISAYLEAQQILGQLGLEMPSNYSQMVSATAAMTSNFQETLSGIEIIPFPDGWEQARRAIDAEVNMVLIGSVFSAMAQSAQ